MSDAFADGRAAGNAAGRLVGIGVVIMAAAAVMVVVVMMIVMMIVVVMMTARANVLGLHGGILHFQFVSHLFLLLFCGV